MAFVVFCDASYQRGRAWAGLTCPALQLRAAAELGPASNSTEAESAAIRWAAAWACGRNIDAIIVNDNQTAVRAAGSAGVRCMWLRSTGNQGNWGLIEAHITATAARTEGRRGTWAAPTRAVKAALGVA